ncbi:MAG: CopG family transcriptional regulator [Dermatophilaceae bacterium]
MTMRRTTVFADEDDLATLKAAAARRGVPEADLLREALRLVALSERTWSEPFFDRTYPVVGRGDHGDAADAVWEKKADEYRRTRTGR